MAKQKIVNFPIPSTFHSFTNQGAESQYSHLIYSLNYGEYFDEKWTAIDITTILGSKYVNSISKCFPYPFSQINKLASLCDVSSSDTLYKMMRN